MSSRRFQFNYSELAERFNVCPRTLHRWRKLGVNLNSPQAVALHIAGQKSPAPAALQAVAAQLENQLSNV